MKVKILNVKINIQTNNNISEISSQNTNEHAMQSPTYLIVHERSGYPCYRKFHALNVNLNSLQIEKVKSYGYSTRLELTCENCKLVAGQLIRILECQVVDNLTLIQNLLMLFINRKSPCCVRNVFNDFRNANYGLKKNFQSA